MDPLTVFVIGAALFLGGAGGVLSSRLRAGMAPAYYGRHRA